MWSLPLAGAGLALIRGMDPPPQFQRRSWRAGRPCLWARRRSCPTACRATTRTSACCSPGSCASTCASTPWAPTAAPASLASCCRMTAAPAAQVRARAVGAGRGAPGMGVVVPPLPPGTGGNPQLPGFPSDQFVSPGRRLLPGAPSTAPSIPLWIQAQGQDPGHRGGSHVPKLCPQHRARRGQVPAPGPGGLFSLPASRVESSESGDPFPSLPPTLISCEMDLSCLRCVPL